MFEGKNIIVCTPEQLAAIVEDAVAKVMASANPEMACVDGNEPLIDRAELVRRLSVTEATIIRYEKKGRIPSYRVGDAARYDWEQVKRALLFKVK